MRSIGSTGGIERVVVAVLLAVAGCADPARAQVKVEKVTCLRQPNCYRLANDSVEVVVTTDVGPRIIRYAFIGQENMLGEIPDDVVKTELGTWKPWGGHRLWTAPEAMPRSYSPDNDRVAHTLEGNTIRLVQPIEPKTGIQKELTVTLDPQGSGVTVAHRLINKGVWDVELAPWALTIMNGGGEVIIPQEPYRSHDEHLLPARPLALWYYTDLSDPRWTIGKKYIRLRTNAQMKEPQKIGVGNRQGWAAYLRKRTLFLKRFAWVEDANYPDFGSNTETYTAGNFIELETLGPLARLAPNGSADHTERWFLFGNVDAGESEQTLDVALQRTLAQTQSDLQSNPLAAFAFLAGSCWQGTFPKKTTTDEHCFEWVHGGRFLRDTHTVRGDAKPYSGETTYAWDPKEKRIVYWYIASDGSQSTGTAAAQGDSIVFPESHVSASGRRELENSWTRTGPDTYRIRVIEKTADGEKELWTMEMRRTR